MQYVPRLLYQGYYPILEHHAESRQFAGLSYKKLGWGDRNQLPPTLRDQIIARKVQLNKPRNLVTSIFDNFVQKDSLLTPSKRKTFLQGYSERYKTLTDIDALQKIYSNSLKALKDLGLGKLISDQYFQFPKIGNIKINTSLKSLIDRNISFDDYKQKVIHGDLHLDNIILSHQGMESFFMDFAHSSPHHCFLDHIVLEFGVRVQLMSIFILDNLEKDESIKNIYKKLITFEIRLIESLGEGKSRLEVDSSLIKYYELIKEIRIDAITRYRGEDAHKYIGGLGLVFASGLRLPLNEDLKEHLRIWFSIASIYNLENYDSLVDNKSSLDFSNYSNESKDKLVSDLLVRNLESSTFVESIFKELKELKQQQNYIINEFSINSEEIKELSHLLEVEFPDLKIKVDKVIDQQEIIHNESEYTGGITFGLPFFMIAINKKIDLPEKIENVVNSLEKKIQRRASSK